MHRLKYSHKELTSAYPCETASPVQHSTSVVRVSTAACVVFNVANGTIGGNLVWLGEGVGWGAQYFVSVFYMEAIHMIFIVINTSYRFVRTI